MYNKIKDLCGTLNALSKDELKETGVDCLLIMCQDTKGNCIEFVKGDLATALAMYGTGLATMSKKSGVPLKVLLADIYETETTLEQLGRRKLKEGE